MLERATRIDLSRYLGKWFEAAALPAWFERGATRVTARYTQRDDHVEVLNTSYAGGRFKSSITGSAITSDKPNVLRVGFPAFKSLSPMNVVARADYVIEFVDTGYKYAVVGSNGKRYIWILARQLPVPLAIYDFLVAKAKAKGYDVSRLVKRD